jgi:hypothetical protein
MPLGDSANVIFTGRDRSRFHRTSTEKNMQMNQSELERVALNIRDLAHLSLLDCTEESRAEEQEERFLRIQRSASEALAVLKSRQALQRRSPAP